MSSPIAKEDKNRVETLMVKSHQVLSHNRRVLFLSQLISEVITGLGLGSAKVLDVGCGDMSIAENLMAMDEGLAVTCLDTYPLPKGLEVNDRWAKYRAFDGRTIPFEDNTVDVAILCDVLHHDFENMPLILAEAGRVARFVIIKDHFEYGWYSRQMLRLMDFIGNWGYGVSVPKRYFTVPNFQQAIAEGDGFIEVKRICPISLYRHSRILSTVCPGKWQFVSLLEVSAN